jgi:Mn2+/Fe2+ NRAMP family transporter
MFESIIEKIVILLVLGIVIAGTYVSFKADNEFKNYYDTPIQELETEKLA